MRNCNYFRVEKGVLKCLSSRPCRLYSGFTDARYKHPTFRICKPHRKRYLKPFIFVMYTFF